MGYFNENSEQSAMQVFSVHLSQETLSDVTWTLHNYTIFYTIIVLELLVGKKILFLQFSLYVVHMLTIVQSM